jgi:sulfotransferase family protein
MSNTKIANHNNSPFFILGVPRSGTTLLAVMLNNHSKVYIPPVSYLGRFLMLQDKMYSLFEETGKIAFNEVWNSMDRLKELHHLDEDSDKETVRDFFLSSFAEEAKKNNKLIWGDKAPPAIDSIDKINFLVPSSKIIHVIRDPRANSLSLKKRQNMNLYIAADYWYDLNLKGIIQGRLLGEKQYLLVKYEELLKNPQEVTQQVCNFLGLEYEEGIVKKLGTSKDTNLKGAYVKKNIDQSKIDTWKKILNVKNVRKIEEICRNLMKAVGYSDFMSIGSPKRLRPIEYIYYSLKQHTRLLFKRERAVMTGRTIENVRIPFGYRIRKYISDISVLFFSDRLKQVFKIK